MAEIISVWPNRRIRANTVKFDVECVGLYYPQTEPSPYGLVNAFIFKYDDVAPHVMKHQREDIGTGIRYCYLTVVPYFDCHFPTNDDFEVDPNITDELYADEEERKVRHYKQAPTTPYINETCLFVQKGDSVFAMGPDIYLDVSIANTYNYDWCLDVATGTAKSDLIIVPVVSAPVPKVYLAGIPYKANLAYVMSDFAMNNCIYSNKGDFRSNEYGAREHIIF